MAAVYRWPGGLEPSGPPQAHAADPGASGQGADARRRRGGRCGGPALGLHAALAQPGKFSTSDLLLPPAGVWLWADPREQLPLLEGRGREASGHWGRGRIRSANRSITLQIAGGQTNRGRGWDGPWSLSPAAAAVNRQVADWWRSETAGGIPGRVEVSSEDGDGVI